ncbi:transmembrane protein 30a [Nannochloropsis gaditana]|uniref:Transmembrane protein 30a n=1 Tax=Nannochloropsis gaditana TaxID=72520 RepID=W7TVJ6_9STRA|nr:transmembrane protein 30a [Nannochloropsis gaditana]
MAGQSNSDTVPLKSRKPEDTAFKQQRLPAWQPILTPKWVIITFTLVGLIFVPLGIVLKIQSDAIVEYSLQYDGEGTPESLADCQILDPNEASAHPPCTVTFDITREMKAPIYVYYQLDNFYQNHRRYVKSRSDAQLMGNVLSEAELSDCDPLRTINVAGETRVLSPCGLIANSFFNDWYVLASPPTGPANLTLDVEGIAWESDVDRRFAQPDGFLAEPNLAGADCDALLGTPPGQAVAATYTPPGGTAGPLPPTPQPWCVFYPEPDKFFYLYQRYPFFPNLAVEGVTNEHFIVWMRTAGLPTFRKLYGKIDQDLPAGTQLSFTVHPGFEVVSFSGRKHLVVSTVSWFGGANSFLGISYIVVGSLCLFLAALFGIKQATCPRKLGDTRYLGWKEQ